MSQPENRSAAVKLPGKLDGKLDEFWVDNPWQIVAHGHNLSAFERNRAYLNVQGKTFVEISHLTGADSDGDGRSVVAADFRNNGMQDLLVRQAGGGVLQLYENRIPAQNYLRLTLRGHRSNRQGIGARITAVINGQQQVRELFPANSFYSQAPASVHLGLGKATHVDSLTIRWPSGKVQVWQNVKGGRQIHVDENNDQALQTITPGQRAGW